MELTYIIAAVAIIILPVILTKLLSARSREPRSALGAMPPERKADAAEEALARAALVARLRVVESKKKESALAHEHAVAKPVTATAGKEIMATERAPGLMETIRHAQAVSEEVQKLAKKGRKVEAIKLIREQSGMGLKEAKHLVDRLG